MSDPADSPVSVQLPCLDIERRAVGHLEATEVAAAQSAIAIATADRVSVELGAVGMAIGEQATVSRAVAGRVVARSVEIEQALVGTLIAGRVTFRSAGGSLVLIAGRVDGDVRTVLDWRGALAAGAVIGLLVGLLRRRG